MFKKTLLALAVAGVSITANAATVKTSVKALAADNTFADVIADLSADDKVDAFGTSGALGGTGAEADSCSEAADVLGFALVKRGFLDDGADGTTPAEDTVTFAGTNTGLAVNSVVFTADDKCTIALAPTLGTNSELAGVEYSTLKAVEIKPVVVAGIGGYKDEDTLTFKISGAKLDLTQTTAPTISVTDLGKVGDVTFDVLDISENQVRFTVQTATPTSENYVAANAVLQLEGLFLDSDGLSTSTAVTVSSFGTNTSGTQFDSASAKTIVTLVPQYTAEIAANGHLNADIDVGKDRQEFVDGLTDTLTLKVTDNLEDLTEVADAKLKPAVATYVLTGDFTWMLDTTIDSNKDGKLSSAEINEAVKYTTAAGNTFKSAALNDTMTELTFKTDVAATVDANPQIEFQVPGFDGELENVLIPTQTFSVKMDVLSTKDVASKTANMPALGKTYAGEWNLNGSIVVLPYIPFGPNTQPILRHTNAGTRVGDVSMRYMIEGEDVTWKELPAAAMSDVKPGVRNILTLVTDALKAEGYNAEENGFKVALEIVTNVPSKDIHVFAGAKVDSSDSSRINLGAYKTNNQ